MFWADSFGSSSWSGNGIFRYAPNKQAVNNIICRTFLIILNVLNLAFTAALQAGDVYTLFVFRLLQGVLVGNFMTLIPTYISEITPKELGSTYGIYPQISVVLGVLVAFSVGVIMTDSFNMQFSNLTPSDT